MSETNSFLKSLADKLNNLDGELGNLKGRAAEVAAEKKVHFEKLASEVMKETEGLRGKIDEYAKKNPDELKSEAEDVMRKASGKISEGLKGLSDFFESKSHPPSGGAGGTGGSGES